MKTIKQTTEFNFFYFFLFLIISVCFLCYYNPVVSEYSVFTRTWGFDNFTYYSTAGQGLILLFALLVIFPKTNSLVLNAFVFISKKAAGFKNKKTLFFAVISFISILVFYAFRTKYFLLGDLNLRLEQIMRKEFLNTEYLTMKLLYYFSAFGIKEGYTAYQMFVVYSCIAGGFFIFFSLLIADLLGKNPLQKVFFFLGHISTGLLLIFCGYIEIYATPVLFLTIYIYFALKYLKYKKHFFIVILTLCIAVASHLLNIAAIPSLFLAWYFANREKVKFITSLSNKTIAIFVSVLILLALSAAFYSNSTFILHIQAPKNIADYMGFFSFRHFWEILNGQILVCGVSFLFIFYLLFKAIKEKINISASSYFLVTITGCIFLVVLIANLHRGSCDWDIMGYTAITLNVLNILLLNEVFKKQIDLLNYLQAAIICLNLINAISWLNINHTDRSIKKIEDMLAYDPGTYYTKFASSKELAVIYKLNKLEDDADRILSRECGKTNSDIWFCKHLVQNLMERKKFEEARIFSEELLTRNRFVPEAYFCLLDYYREKSKEKFEFYLQNLYISFIQQPGIFLAKTKPAIYINMFEYLYNLEVPKQDKRKLDEIMSVIQKLKTEKQ